MAIRRSKANARRALRAVRALIVVLAIVVVWHLIQAAGHAESGTSELWRKIAVLAIIVAVFLLPEKLVKRASRRSAAWIVEHDAAWRIAALVLYARAPFHWLAAHLGRAVRALARGLWTALGSTRAFQFLDRHRRTVCIVLVAAMSLRSLAAVTLLQHNGGATLWHWAALGPTYILFGVTAPFVALLLVMRKGEWVLVTALMWLLIGWLATLLALLVSYWLSGTQLPLLVYPLLSEPVHFSLFLALGFAELLVQTAAIHYLGGRTADYYHGLKSDAV